MSMFGLNCYEIFDYDVNKKSFKTSNTNLFISMIYLWKGRNAIINPTRVNIGPNVYFILNVTDVKYPENIDNIKIKLHCHQYDAREVYKELIKHLGDFMNIKKSRKSFTYLAHDTLNNIYKIGRSVDPNKRIRSMKTAVPHINLVCTIYDDIEYKLHCKFRKQRIKGEWFNLSKEDVNHIISLSNH